MKEVISVRFRSGCKNYYFSPGQLTVAPGQDVIVETAQGPEYVTCTQGNHTVEDHQVVEPLRRVLRPANGPGPGKGGLCGLPEEDRPAGSGDEAGPGGKLL